MTTTKADRAGAADSSADAVECTVPPAATDTVDVPDDDTLAAMAVTQNGSLRKVSR